MRCGILIAQRLGWRWSLAMFVAIEIVLLFWIRDSLVLNVLMLVFPLEQSKCGKWGEGFEPGVPGHRSAFGPMSLGATS